MDAIDNNQATPNTRKARRFKRIWFGVFTALAIIVLALVVGEFILGAKQRWIQRGDKMDPDFLRYDAELGWSLTPNWKGRHRNFDFDVEYSLNQRGFRADANLPQEKTVPIYAFVGDSFTFGLGVNDDATFVRQLNDLPRSAARCVNFAVPGYSTDQEALLIERDILELAPKVVLMVVYLGNDPFDNRLAFPLQANLAKPYFSLHENELQLQNEPVPQTRKTMADSSLNLSIMVLGNDYERKNVLNRWEQHSLIIKLLRENFLPPPVLTPDFDARFIPYEKLFNAIVERVAKKCADRQIAFKLVLMPGSSFVTRPTSISAQYQDWFRCNFIQDHEKEGVQVIDLAMRLRERHQKTGGKWFYPNDGHLTPEGHRIVAEILAKELF